MTSSNSQIQTLGTLRADFVFGKLMAGYLKRRQYSDPWQLKTQLVQESPTLVFQMRDCEIVSEVPQVMPNAGEIYIIGLLRSRGMQIQRSRWTKRKT